MAGRWFSLSTAVSSTNITDLHDIPVLTEILLKVVLSTIKPNLIKMMVYTNKILHCILVPLPCIVGPWSSWSQPDATGTRSRIRYVVRPPLNGGHACPDLIQIGKG